LSVELRTGNVLCSLHIEGIVPTASTGRGAIRRARVRYGYKGH
jgi:hypothetical protein